MIDLHSHVLPGIDDGATSPQETAEMLGLWASYGFERVAATHHLSGDLRGDYQERIRRTADQVSPIVAGSGVEVVPGFEIMLDPGLPERLQRGETLTLGGSRSVLVEVPFLIWPSYTDEVIFSIQLAGFQPILAHPERYEAVQGDTSLATSLARRGVVLQLTYASLAGALGAPVKRAAERLIDLDTPLILASDAHSPGQRLLAIPEGMRRAEALVGGDRLRQMTTDIPAALLADAALPEPAPVRPDMAGEGRLRRLLRGR